jgi:hypothetical protein
MDLANSNTNSSMRPRIGPTLRFLIAAAATLVNCGIAFGATPAPTVASLNGPYVFHFSVIKEAQWSTTKNCTYKGDTNTYWAGDQSAYTEMAYGTATFDGKGHVTLVMTDNHKLNQAASNATATITCKSTGGANTIGGNMVYEAPVTSTVTAAYTVSASGTGAITLPDDQGTLDLDLTLFTSSGLSTTLLMRSMDNNIGTGIAVHK